MVRMPSEKAVHESLTPLAEQAALQAGFLPRTSSGYKFGKQNLAPSLIQHGGPRSPHSPSPFANAHFSSSSRPQVVGIRHLSMPETDVHVVPAPMADMAGRSPGPSPRGFVAAGDEDATPMRRHRASIARQAFAAHATLQHGHSRVET